ncbi:MAG: HAD-IA family hydrolase [Rhodospirillales bacterium]|nr:HAD-IA family hydrolase [Rhodospirillales bacterium]
MPSGRDTGEPSRPNGAEAPAVIFDVDGVLVDSPHERAWQESLEKLMAGPWRDVAARTSYTPERFTSEVYQTRLSGKPRMSGARSVLDFFGVPDVERRAVEYADYKQAQIETLIDAGEFVAYPDALRFVSALRASGVPLAAASSSKNANRFMVQIHLDDGVTLLDVFKANVCGRDLKHGKPHPEIFLLAAEALAVPPQRCVVVEDAAAGIAAAKAGGMLGLGIARFDDEDLLAAEKADLVVTSLDDVSLSDLLAGRLLRGAGTGAAVAPGE